MELIALLGASSYCVAACWVGVRLLALARRSGELPERLIGIALLLGGGIGYPAAIVANRAFGAAPDTGRLVFVGAWGALIASSICLAAFWQLTYHRGEIWARWLTRILVAPLLVSMLGVAMTLPGPGELAANRTYTLGLAFMTCVFALNGTASLRYYRLLRRRLRIGLARPLVVNRVLLWSLAAWAVTGQFVYSLGRALLTGQVLMRGIETALVSSLGLVAAGTMVLAFLPPQRYRVWVAQGAPPMPAD